MKWYVGLLWLLFPSTTACLDLSVVMKDLKAVDTGPIPVRTPVESERRE